MFLWTFRILTTASMHYFSVAINPLGLCCFSQHFRRPWKIAGMHHRQHALLWRWMRITKSQIEQNGGALWVWGKIWYWLVVWNIFIFPYIGNNHPNWLICFRGLETTNQCLSLGWKFDHVQLWFTRTASVGRKFGHDFPTKTARISTAVLRLNTWETIGKI